MMKKQTCMVLVLVWTLAACTPTAPSTQPTPSLPPAASLTAPRSPSPISTPLAGPNPTEALSSSPAPPGELTLLPSPDGNWTAILDREVGRLEVEDVQGEKQIIFPPGSTIGEAKWSPDSRRLAVVLSHLPEKSDQDQLMESPEIRVITFEGGAFREAEPGLIAGEASRGQFVLGAWSPDSLRLLFWLGPLSASLKADGLPLWVLDTESMQATRLSETTLVNPAYQSWSPDGSALVFTDGGYRSALVNKWLSLYEVKSGQVRSLIARSELIPGAVSWSPAGDTDDPEGIVAFAAVKESQTGKEWADWMDWDNPAIQAHRIYLLDPQAGGYRRLNAAEAYQDAPRWSADGETLYYVQLDGDQAVLMTANPATGEAQRIPGCQGLRPSGAGYYGQVDWTGLYQNCPEAVQSFAPALSSPSTPEQDDRSGHIEAINVLRALFGLPNLPLEFVETTTMINSPNGDLEVALYQDSEGSNYSVESQSNLVVEIDARVALPAISPEAPTLSQEELSARANTLIGEAIPDFDSLQAGLSYEEGVKEDYFFFTWRVADSSPFINKPFAQIGLHKSGELFAYYNTLSAEQAVDCSTVERLETDSPEAQQVLEEFIRNYREQYPTEAMGMAILHRVDRLGEWAVVTGSIVGEGKDIIAVRQTPDGYQIVEHNHISPPLESPGDLEKRVIQHFLQKVPEAPEALFTCLDQTWLLAGGYPREPSGVFQLAYVGTSDNTAEGVTEINTLQSDGSNRATILSEPMLILGLVSSPDGERIAFWGCPGSLANDCSADEGLDVWVVNWDGSDLRKLTEDSEANDSHPDWSPDGEQIVFDSDRSGDLQIYIMNADGSSPRALTSGSRQNTAPKWSPDGKWIAFHCSQAGETRICVVSLDGQPAGEPISGTTPVWSPESLEDGARLAFLCFKEGHSDICTARPDGSERVNLTNSPADEHSPAWSPDGNWLAFVSNRGGDVDVYKVCVTCPGEPAAVRLTDEPRAAGGPAWSPDGGQVVYVDVGAGDLLLVNADRSDATWLTSGIFSPPIWRP